MTAYRAVKTLTDIFGHPDTYVNQGIPDTNFGENVNLVVEGTTDTTDKRILILLNLPPAPSDADTDQGNEGLVGANLVLHHTSGLNATSRTYIIHELTRTFDEDTDTWTTKGVGNSGDTVGSFIVTDDGSPEDDHIIDIDDIITDVGTLWGEAITVRISYSSGAQDELDIFDSREGTDPPDRPELRLEYLLKPPEQITDLAISPDPSDATRPKLTWTPSSDENFHHYEIWRKVGAGAWAQVGSDITVQGQGEYVDTAGGLTENNVILYKIREEGSEGDTPNDRSYNESNEIWMIRPDISIFTVSDTTPNVLQELTFTVAGAGIASTPTPVTNDWYDYIFGTSSENDSSSSRVTDLTRTHKYPYEGNQTPKMQIENSLGFKSDKTNLTTGGPTLTVADIVPIALIRASPVKVGFDVTIRFFGDESYAPAGNKELASTNAYEWDKDHSGAFVADDITTIPYKDYTWTSGDGAGTKVVALRVKDEDNDYSTHVEITVEVVAIATTDLDSAFSDGFEVIDVERGRTVIRQQGLEAKKVHRGSEELVGVSIGGFAFTDTDTDGTPDDIEILEDIVTNNKRVQLTIFETVRYGAIIRFRTHTEGGWDDKFNWTAEVVLE